jgi:hypothetical protein
LFPVALALTGLRVDEAVPWILFGVLQVASARLAWLSVVQDAYINLMDAAFWVFVYVFFGIAALFQRMAGVFPWAPSGITSDELLRTDFLLVIGLLAYAIGRLLAPRQRLLEIEATTGYRRVFVAALVVAVVWPSAYVAMFGLDAILVDRMTRGSLIAALSSDSSTRTFLGSLLSTPPLALMPAVLLMWPIARHRKTFVLAMAGLIVANLVINNFVNSARYSSGTVLLASVLAFLIAGSTRRHWLRLGPAALVIGLTLVFPFADAFRSIYQTLAPRPVSELLVATGDYDAYVQIVNAVRLVDARGIWLGENLAGVAAFWVPRSVWPAKPRPTGEYLAEHAGFTYTNLSAPLWAEGFVAFGVVGVVGLLMAWGAVSGALDMSLKRHVRQTRRSVSPSVALAVILAPYSLFLVRGALMPTFAYVVPVLVVLAVLARPRFLLRHTAPA